jgi:hypothetical protein
MNPNACLHACTHALAHMHVCEQARSQGHTSARCKARGRIMPCTCAQPDGPRSASKMPKIEVCLSYHLSILTACTIAGRKCSASFLVRTTALSNGCLSEVARC